MTIRNDLMEVASGADGGSIICAVCEWIAWNGC